MSCFQQSEVPVGGGPKKKDYGILESVLGSPMCEVRGTRQEKNNDDETATMMSVIPTTETPIFLQIIL